MSLAKRIPKAYLINGFLLAAAIVSWTLFLNWRSTARERAATDGPAVQFLYTRLPEKITAVQLFPGPDRDQAIPAFPVLNEKPAAASGSPEVEALIQFHILLAFARETGEDPAWKRLGEADVSGPSGAKPSVITVYEAPGGAIGFQMDGTSYLADGEPAQKVLQFIHNRQNDAGKP